MDPIPINSGPDFSLQELTAKDTLEELLKVSMLQVYFMQKKCLINPPLPLRSKA